LAVRKNDCVGTGDDIVIDRLASVALTEHPVDLHGSGRGVDWLIAPASEIDGSAFMGLATRQITFSGVEASAFESGRPRSVLSEPRHLGISTCSFNEETSMQTATALTSNDAPVSPVPNPSARYARCIKVSKHVRWDIDRDVIRGRNYDYDRTFLPSGLSQVDKLEFLTAAEKRLLTQVQGRTYTYMFGLVERFIGAKVLQLSGQHWLGDQTALEALVRFSDEELKHQELFRRLEAMLAAGMPTGWTPVAEANAVARYVLSKRTWAVLALTAHIELFSQSHFVHSIQPQENLCPLWKDVFMFHWREESQHAVMDELEWQAEDARISAEERDAAVGDLIELVGAVDGILQGQSNADATYFASLCGQRFTAEQRAEIGAAVLRAYRWQYIVSGAQHPHFTKLLTSMTTPEQMQRIGSALAPLMA
jgi:hypothetical protein